MDRQSAAGISGAIALVMLVLVVGLGPGRLWDRPMSPTVVEAGSTAHGRTPTLLAKRRELPEVEFGGVNHETVSLKRFSGRVVVLSLWAPWCAPCVKEMPSLDRLVDLVPGIAVVPVNVDAKGLSGAVAFYSKHALTNLAPYYDSSGKMFGLLDGRGLPTSLIIDREGRVAAVVEGAVDWTSDTMLSLLLQI